MGVRLVDEFQRASPYNFTLELGAYPVAEARESIVKNALYVGVVLLLPPPPAENTRRHRLPATEKNRGCHCCFRASTWQALLIFGHKF